MTFLAHLRQRPTKQPTNRSTPTACDVIVRATVRAVCDPQHTTHVRDLLSRVADHPDTALLSLHSRPAPEHTGSATLEAVLDIRGLAAEPVNRLLTQVWLDPAVRDLHWHLEYNTQPHHRNQSRTRAR
ncbi:hypothetical protein [Streptacidiphilus sp. EB129]|uniref:hypothetical protein n=1 Tax=Streptacidiphilus sp. EB129 TaxID=3156262 RepID=UPI003515027E